MRVRKMLLSDAAWVAGLSAQLGYETQAVSLTRRFERLRQWRDSEVFVAAAGDEWVGWLHIYGVKLLETEGYAEIGGLVVQETMRRQGVGSALVRQAERWAQEVGYSELRLRSGVHRQDAHSFYRSIGYVQAKTSYMFRKEL